jgi:hypothetical protein
MFALSDPARQLQWRVTPLPIAQAATLFGRPPAPDDAIQSGLVATLTVKSITGN